MQQPQARPGQHRQRYKSGTCKVATVQVGVCGVTEGAVCVCVCVLYWMSPIAEERVRNEKCQAG